MRAAPQDRRARARRVSRPSWSYPARIAPPARFALAGRAARAPVHNACAASCPAPPGVPSARWPARGLPAQAATGDQDPGRAWCRLATACAWSVPPPWLNRASAGALRQQFIGWQPVSALLSALRSQNCCRDTDGDEQQACANHECQVEAVSQRNLLRGPAIEQLLGARRRERCQYRQAERTAHLGGGID